MEYMPDGCLLSYYHANANPKPSITTRLALSMDIAAGMAFLHSQDPPVLHRDLKTPNILVRRDASGDVRAKISDLGSAAVMRLSTITSMMGSVMMERDREKRTLVGTYLYMAPELSGARIRYRCETDVFAFGVVLSEIASWEGPYGIPMEEFNHTLFNDCRSRKEPFPIDLEDVPEPFHDLVSGCLSVDPKARLTFSEISEALERMNEATDEGAGEGVWKGRSA
ncbi:kinase-like domain-containing protein [Chytridium lagenaria]|nr:kinase-like domain-containing protein [Chytridium lagenaria]